MTEHLISAWSEVLDMEKSEIEDDDNFFEIGGDSVTAMRLVTAAQDLDIGINAEIIFNHPILSDMRSHCEERVNRISNINSPAPTLDPHLVSHCASVCDVDPDVIEDIFPSVPEQTWILNEHITAKNPGNFMKQIVFQVEGVSDISTVIAAFEAVWKKNGILRTRLVQHETQCYQAVLGGNIQWGESSQLNDYLSHDNAVRMRFGDPLARFAVVKEAANVFIVWTVLHCVDDEWSRNLLLDGLGQYLLSPSVYLGSAKPPPFKQFVQYRSSISAEAIPRWEVYMKDYKLQNSLWTVPEDYRPAKAKIVVQEASICLDSRAYGGLSISSIAHGAFSLAYASINGNLDDVVFKTVRMGRQISLQGIESIMGLLSCIIPLRVRPNSHSTVLGLLRQIQADAVSMMPYEPLAQSATKIPNTRLPMFNWRMNEVDIFERTATFKDGDQEASIRPRADLSPLRPVNLPLYVGARMLKDKVEVKAGFDGLLLETSTVNELVDRFLRVLKTMVDHDLQVSVQDIMAMM